MRISDRNKFFSRKFVALFLVLLCFISLSFFQKELKNTFFKISEPIQKFLWQKGNEISDFFRAILKSKDLEKELTVAQLRNQELLAEIAKLKELRKENEILRDALEIGLQKDFELILANVISKDSFEDSIIIDSGLKEGILKDFPVITQQKVLLGRVSEVYESFSEVSLISNKEMSFSAKIQEPVLNENEEKEIKGIIRGRGNLKLSFELALKKAEIEKDDILITDVLGGVFPEGLLIGKVLEIEKLDIEPFQKANLVPLFELKKIDKVFLIKKW